MIRRNALIAAACGVFLAACGSSTPTAVPVPTPAPTPKATPTPEAMLGCGLPPMPDLHNQCPHLDAGGAYWGDVDGAIKQVFKDHPELFDFNDTKGGGLYSFKVLDRRRYTGAVVNALRQAGFCAVDQVEEVAVKRTNDFNEQYNVWTSDGYVRSGPGAYVTTCYPAQF